MKKFKASSSSASSMALLPNFSLPSLIPSLQASLSSADLLRLLNFDVPLAPLSNSSYHFRVGLPFVLLTSMYPSSAFLGTLSSSSRDPPNEVFSICYPCLTPFPCISYKFLDESCLVIVHYLTQVHRLSVRQ